ncbi:MAG: sulfite dehydrogenase, partial [Pseudomonadota bacterium]
MSKNEQPQPAGANGLLDRRWFLRAGAAGGASLLTASARAKERASWSQMPGAGMDDSGEPSPHEAQLRRLHIGSRPGTNGAGSSRTPLQHLDGIITPSRLHFERHHSGIPAIDPDRHRLVIHGLVDRPLSFSVDALA